ncbi:MAG: DNA 3'-phosphatase, partial [Cyanobacteria bacterium]|nr:DNA 3'-phosphatase [Cyanobacteriota bacterium]
KNVKKRKSDEGPLGCFWDEHDSLRVLNHPSFVETPAKKVASFDMDGTLINPKSGAKFPKSRSDWMWFHDSVAPKLKKLHADGHRIVIFTNQAGVEKKQVDERDLMVCFFPFNDCCFQQKKKKKKKGKIFDLVEELQVPMQVVMSCASDHYRKPHMAMWDYFVNNLNHGVRPTEAFYCGDAAGRLTGWKTPKTKRDFSCSDRKFASNCGMQFHTPEEFFLGEAPTTKWNWEGPSPHDLLAKYEDKNPKGDDLVSASDKQEMVIFVGMPASGKSTLAKKVFEAAGYVRANNDDHGNKQKCLKICTEALKRGASCVVDNTNPDAETRKQFISLAKEHGVKQIRCFFMSTPREICDHLNLLREEMHHVKRVPDVALNTFNARLVKPTASEGFTEVTEIPFKIRFDKPQHRELFLKWQ